MNKVVTRATEVANILEFFANYLSWRNVANSELVMNHFWCCSSLQLLKLAPTFTLILSRSVYSFAFACFTSAVRLILGISVTCWRMRNGQFCHCWFVGHCGCKSFDIFAKDCEPTEQVTKWLTVLQILFWLWLVSYKLVTSPGYIPASRLQHAPWPWTGLSDG